MAVLAIIGGTGLTAISELKINEKKRIETPHGNTSGPLVFGELAGKKIVFLFRHGDNHTIPPHKINYLANIWGLHSVGVTHIIATACVGSINKNVSPEKIVIPDQIIDYTYSRKHTFFESETDQVTHIDFTYPYCDELRQMLLHAAKDSNMNVHQKGTYGATQGPRLESIAEIDRMERDGCDIVGMTGMPEAVLAKELGICYATLAISANWAAGRSEKELSLDEIKKAINSGMPSVNKLLCSVVKIFYS